MDVMEPQHLGFHIKQDPISSEDISPALGTTTDGMAVVPLFARMQGFGDYETDEIASAIKSRDHKDATDLIIEPKAFKASHFTRGKDGAPSDLAPPLSADADRGDQDTLVVGTLNTRTSRSVGADDAANGHMVPMAGRPRRLMPIECERLQGWEDDHTNVPNLKGKKPKPASDSERYRAIGNGVASPVVHWIGLRIISELNRSNISPDTP